MDFDEIAKKEEYVRRAKAKSDHPYFRKFQRIVDGNLTIGGEERKYSIFFREDPFGTHTCSISEARAKRPRAIGEVISNEIPKEKCIFCPPKISELTPEPRILHGQGIADRNRWEIVSVPNLYPFSLEHYVTVFSEHKPHLIDLNLDDMIAYINSLYELADRFRKNKARGMWDIINWGPAAGASQSHPHAQRGPIMEEMMGLDMILIDSIKESRLVSKLAYRIGGDDPYEHFLKQLRNSDLFIWETKEDGGIFIYAPLAPKFPHQVDIAVKKRVGNVLQLERNEREMMAKSMLGVFHALTKKLGVTDVNVVMHQELFDLSERSSYRMHWHIMPRNLNKIAGFEVGVGSYIVPFFPEETAAVLREYYGGKW